MYTMYRIRKIDNSSTLKSNLNKHSIELTEDILLNNLHQIHHFHFILFQFAYYRLDWIIAFLKSMESSLSFYKNYYTFVTFNIINIHIHKCSFCIEFSICERNIYINKNKNILLDKDKLVV